MKINFIFQLADQGWTETWYADAANPREATMLSNTELAGIVNLRANACILRGIRAVEVGGFHRGYTRPINMYSDHTPATPPDVTAVSATCRAVTFQGQNRPLFLRGLDDVDVRRYTDGGSNPSAYLIQGITNYKNVIIGRNYQIQFLRPTDVAGYQWQQVTWLAPKTGSQDAVIEVHVASGASFPAVGTKIYFKGLNSCTFPNLIGQYIVTEVFAGWFNIAARWLPKTVLEYPINAYWRKADYAYGFVTAIDFQRFATRDTGRPIAQSRGRRRGRRVCR